MNSGKRVHTAASRLDAPDRSQPTRVSTAASCLARAADGRAGGPGGALCRAGVSVRGSTAAPWLAFRLASQAGGDQRADEAGTPGPHPDAKALFQSASNGNTCRVANGDHSAED